MSQALMTPPAKSNIAASKSSTFDLKVVKRNNESTDFDRSKITVAITKAFLDTENTTDPVKVHDIALQLTGDVYEQIAKYFNNRKTIHIEEIQDQVEFILMRNGYYQIAKSYVIYREERRKLRDQQQQKNSELTLHVVLDNNNKVVIDQDKVAKPIIAACQNLEGVSAKPIIKETLKNIFDGIHISDVRQAAIMSARTLIESEPNYGYVAARLLLNNIQIEVAKTLNLPTPNDSQQIKEYYRAALVASINYGIKAGRIDQKLQDFDLNKLSTAIIADNDLQFTYLGLQTLYDRYFLHEENMRYELPQIFFMRVAMGLALAEDNKEQRAIEFYKLLSSFDYMSSTPTLFNSGTVRSQLSSCYLSTVPDDLHEIYSAIRDNAMLQKFAGGIGNDWTPVRAMHAQIKGTNGKSQGVIPFLKVVNDTGVAVNQGGKRKGAVCSYLETWHLDIEEFLELRKNTGDERRRTHDMNTANWIPDLFMQRVIENQEWTLFSPDETPELHELYGDAFNYAYLNYEKQAAMGNIRNFKKISAVALWRKMLSMLFETGHPWVTFKDPSNLRSPQQHAGVIHSSNLCTEILLNTSKDEIAVCNLGSINLAAHITEGKLDTKKLQQTITTAIRMLDNVVDINYYAVAQARNSNLQHRPIGLGIMGFQDALYKLNVSYESKEAVEFADRSMEQISYFAILASSELAKERGSYSSFEGSLWSKGILPIDSIDLLKKYRGKYLEQDTSTTLDWNDLRNKVRCNGMRNSNVLAIAPTATISNICGVSQSIEPTYQNLYVKSNLSGEFTITNQYLVQDLKALNIWDPVMINDLKYFDGSIQKIDRIPTQLKQKYRTAFEIDANWLVECASRRQKWIDQAQSLNLYMAAPSGKKLDNLYQTAWLKGLKTTYYLRSLGATDTEKSTVNRSTLNAVQSNVCPIDDPTCESCQ